MTVETAASLLEVSDLWIEATIGGVSRPLVTGVSLQVEPGEVLAIVGESGSGKSLTARALTGLLPEGLRASGKVLFEGRSLLGARERQLQEVRGGGIALVLQDPFTTLNPLKKCREQLQPTRGKRLSRAERLEGAIRRLAEVGIRDPNVADRYPWQLSGGMQQRVALAAALSNDPKVLIADEFSTALDVTTQKEVWLLLRRIQKERGMGLIIITHDLRMAFSMCDRVHVMYAGSFVETGGAQAIEDLPLHPYTLGLLLSEPDVNSRSEASTLMRGSVPRADEVLDRCAFAARCTWSEAECVAGRPSLRDVDAGRVSACIRIDTIVDEVAALRQEHRNRSVGDVTHVITEKLDPVVVVSDLRKVFVDSVGRSEEKSVVALNGVSLAVGRGECVGLVGESGSGKTTLARCLVGLETATSGSIKIAGLEVTRPLCLTKEELHQVRSSIQYIFQDPYSSLNPTKTVGSTLREAVALRGDLGGPRAVSRRVQELLEIVGLPGHYHSRKPVALSGGERQRVAIARALALEPQVVVCDEPVSSLDVSVQAQVLELFNEIRARTAVSYLFISHDLGVVRQVADRICVLYKGEIVEEGPADELLERPRAEYTRALVSAVPGNWDRDSGLTADTLANRMEPQSGGHSLEEVPRPV